MDADRKAANHAQDASSAKGAEAHSCQELLRADSGVLNDNRGITVGLHSQLRESQEMEADLQRRLEVTRGRAADVWARLEGCRTRKASLAEAAPCAVQDL